MKRKKAELASINPTPEIDTVHALYSPTDEIMSAAGQLAAVVETALSQPNANMTHLVLHRQGRLLAAVVRGMVHGRAHQGGGGGGQAGEGGPTGPSAPR